MWNGLRKAKNMIIDVDSDDSTESDEQDFYPNLGETILLGSGEIGTIRFIGAVHFAKGNWIGVELHDTYGPHDGAVGGVRYFTCPTKRGIFVKLKNQKKTKIMIQDILWDLYFDELYTKKYNPLIYGYCKDCENKMDISNVPRGLIKLIIQYYPFFVKSIPDDDEDNDSESFSEVD